MLSACVCRVKDSVKHRALLLVLIFISKLCRCMHGFHLNILRLLHVCDAEVFHCDCTHGLASSEQRSMSRLATGRGMNNACFVTGLINPASCLTYAELDSLVRARGVFEVRKRTTQPCSHFINDHLVPGLMYVP